MFLKQIENWKILGTFLADFEILTDVGHNTANFHVAIYSTWWEFQFLSCNKCFLFSRIFKDMIEFRNKLLCNHSTFHWRHLAISKTNLATFLQNEVDNTFCFLFSALIFLELLNSKAFQSHDKTQNQLQRVHNLLLFILAPFYQV